VNSKEDLVKKLLPLKEQKEKIVVNKKQQEAVKVKAEEKVEQLKKQLALAEAELAEANTGITVFINSEKKRVDSINALRDEVNQTVKTLRNLQSDYELAMLTKKELEGLLLVITQSSSPWRTLNLKLFSILYNRQLASLIQGLFWLFLDRYILFFNLNSPLDRSQCCVCCANLVPSNLP